MKTLGIKNRSRREFLRQLSIGTAAVAAGAGFAGNAKGQTPTSSDTPPAAPKNGRKKLGVALLGLGHYATNELAPALQMTKNCELVGAISGHPEKLAAWKQQYNLPDKNLYSYQMMDRMADNPDIDIVYVVTPPALHPVYAIRAAIAGKHVISEKPMATLPDDCQAMIDSCKAANRKLAIGYRLHFDPYFKEIGRLAQEVGPFMKMTGDRGFVFGERAWRVDKLLAGGGPLMDLGIYLIQAACAAAGEVAPVAVTAKERPKERPDFFCNVEETLDFALEFPNGAVFTGVTSYNHSFDTFRAEGGKGFIDFQAHAFSYSPGTVVTSRGPLYFPTPPPDENGRSCYQQAWQMDDFADCIVNNRETPVPGEMGLRDIKITTAIYEAARTGKKVAV